MTRPRPVYLLCVMALLAPAWGHPEETAAQGQTPPKRFTVAPLELPPPTLGNAVPPVPLLKPQVQQRPGTSRPPVCTMRIREAPAVDAAAVREGPRGDDRIARASTCVAESER
jgi:hypothetical protein